MFGVLGHQESLKLTLYEKHYQELEGHEKLYRKVS